MQITAKTLPSPEEAATRNLLEARRNMSRQRGGRTNAGQNEGAHKLSHEAGGVRVLHRFGSGSVCEGKTREREMCYVRIRRQLKSFLLLGGSTVSTFCQESQDSTSHDVL